MEAVQKVTTWRCPPGFDFSSARTLKPAFLRALAGMRQKEAQALPARWGRDRAPFKHFIAPFFVVHFINRQSARQLLQDTSKFLPVAAVGAQATEAVGAQAISAVGAEATAAVGAKANAAVGATQARDGEPAETGAHSEPDGRRAT